jgi:hypothetical protein
MTTKTARTIAWGTFALLLALSTWGQAQDAKAPYPSMAALDQYLIADRNAEITMARSAAPQSISRDAEVMVLARHGYETAVKGKNGFVCMVLRSWTAGIDDLNFWNPKLRGAICLNATAARSYVPMTLKKTDLILAGQSRVQMFDSIKSAFDKKELPTVEAGAMSYMLSKQSYLSDGAGHWHPHLMFFLPPTESATWGADLAGSPVLAANDPEDRMTVFMVPVSKWSDGTADATEH